MKRVVGFDPSLTSFGISDGLHSERFRTSPEDGDTLARTRKIFERIVTFMSIYDGEDPQDVERVYVIEGPSFGSAMAGALWDAGYLRAHFDTFAAAHGARVHIVPPATLKKFVTGKGNTPKAEMALRVFRKWGIDFSDDPGADKLHAYCLYRYGVALEAGEIEHAVPKARGKGKDRVAGVARAAKKRPVRA